MSRAEPLLQPHDKADTADRILQDPTALPEKEDIKRRRKFCNDVLGIILVIGTQLSNVVSAEILQIEERGCVGANTSDVNITTASNACVKAFNSPYFSIWFNHSITGLSASRLVGRSAGHSNTV